MTITKESLVDLQEKHNKVVKLLDEGSKSDPETEPFLSKYSARQILIGMKANIENLIRTSSSDGQDNPKLPAMLAIVYYYLALIAIDTEENSTVEKHLEKCKEIIEKYENEPEAVLTAMNMYNTFGINWSQRDPEKSKFYLDKSEQLYHKFKQQSIPPIDTTDLFQVNLEVYDQQAALKNMERIHTLTYFYKAQIYGKLKDAMKSSVYCHVTLQRQLQMGEYDHIDWALNSASLSQFFMEKNGFKQARHHLAASLYMLDLYEKELSAITERDEAYEAKMETFKHRSADVARCWSKYGLILLTKSKERLLNHTDDLDVNCSSISDLSQLELSPDSTVSMDDLKNLVFTDIDVTAYEEQITDHFVLTLEDARRVFINAQQWTAKAQEYYSLDSLASDYIEIVLDQTQLYLNLLFFEDNADNQAKLHKRRANLLENILDKVNAQYYLQYCRQVWFELARTYADILDIKSEKLRENKGRAPPQALAKINTLVDKSIQHFTNFIDSFKESISKCMTTKLSDDIEKPILQAYFHIAALNGRYVVQDKDRQLKNTEASLEHYKFVAHYCDKHAKAKEMLSMEYGICKEMVSLLPIKIMKLKIA